MPTIQLKKSDSEYKVPVILRPHSKQDWQAISVKDDTEAALMKLRREMKEARLVEVWSIDPAVDLGKAAPVSGRLHPFHGFHVIGREEIRNRDEINELLYAVIMSVATAPEETADCFMPRHGLRIYGLKGFVDVVLCYSCENGLIIEGKEKAWFATSKTAESTFDAVFKKLNLRKAD